MKVKKVNTNKVVEQSSECSVAFCMQMIGGKWKPIILFRIFNKINRYGKLLKSINGINKQMLSKQLKELEKDGLIERKVFAEIPPRVEYSFTEKGKSLMPVVQAMNRWGRKNKKNQKIIAPIKADQLPLFEF